MNRVGVIGLGKLGACLAAVLADDNYVIGYDTNQTTVDTLTDGRAPVNEPGLADRIGRWSGRTLFATSDMRRLAASTDIAFVIVPTPSDDAGRFDNRHVLDAVGELDRALTEADVERYTVVIVSTVMPGSCAGPIRQVLDERFSLVYSPEFIALGSVIRDMTHPDVVLIGCDDADGADAVEKVLLSVVAVPAAWHRMPLVDAELAKLSLNVALSVKIAYANEVASICEQVGADAERVLAAVGDDSRIGSKYLAPGGPASGPCLPRDLVAFDRLADDTRCEASVAAAAGRVHHRQAAWLLGRLLDLSPVPRPTVGVLGGAYKPGTAVTDESVGVRVACHALSEGLAVVMHDPAADLGAWDVKCAGSGQQVVDEADVVLVATAWPEYGSVEFGVVPTVDLWGVALSGVNVHRFGRGGP